MTSEEQLLPAELWARYRRGAIAWGLLAAAAASAVVWLYVTGWPAETPRDELEAMVVDLKRQGARVVAAFAAALTSAAALAHVVRLATLARRHRTR